MNTFVKFFSLALLIVIFGLLGLGVIINNQSHAAQPHFGSVDCFGAGCGPVQHIVSHEYVVRSLFSLPLLFQYSNTISNKQIIFQEPYLIIDSPPPQFSLS